VSESNPRDAATSTLLARLQRGDRAAFDELFALYRPGLCDFIANRLGPRLAGRVDQSDVAQEVLLEAYERLDDFIERRPMPFRSWLWKTAYERLLKVRRHHARLRRDVDREVPWPDHSSLLLVRSLVQSTSSPGRQLEEQELVQRARLTLSQLAEMDREILFLRVAEGLPYEEVGHILGIEPSAARQRYGRALLRLRKALIEQGLLEADT
jgi:RNA polymerase sigma-70 factor (ECF subfamily)